MKTTPQRHHFFLLDYLELMKPELTGLSVLTTLCGFYLGATGEFKLPLFLLTALGTLFVGGGAGALNQYIERNYDALMKRTERRPLPTGRLQPVEVLLFGTTISIAGMFLLIFFANPLTGFLAFITFTTYLFLYTPLKRVSPISTLIGGIPGALPPMMGWTAVRNEITIEAWILFAILFCWQMPHFFSLAWMYKKDYARAGFKILSVLDTTGQKTSRQILIYTIALLPLSIASSIIGLTGITTVIGAVVLGMGLLFLSILLTTFSHTAGHETFSKMNYYSRKVFYASLVYLPALMLLLTLDKI
ncbi:MAG TPA: heme o synthase [Bacteroidota bacterium]|nr:heme o synthase [Bacteroidota bacterium]